MSDTITLHESNAGHLVIVQDGAAYAYDVTEAAEPEPAEYDGASGEVRLLANRVGGMTPGHAARAYIGAVHYGEQPATEPAEDHA